MIKKSYSFFLLLLFALPACAGDDRCLNEMAMKLIKEATDDNPVPESLLYPRQKETVPGEQIDLLEQISMAHVFEAEDFCFSVLKRDDDPRMKMAHGVSYQIEPTHEIHIYNKHWKPNVPVLVFGAISEAEKCYLIMPVLSDEKFEDMKEYYASVLFRASNYADSLTSSRSEELLRIFKTEGSYEDRLELIGDETGLGEQEVIFLLSELERSGG